MIEESDWNETKNQVGASPEPDVLMKHIEYDDTKHKQVFFHRRPEINKAIEEVSSHKKARKSQRKIPFVTFCAFCG